MATTHSPSEEEEEEEDHLHEFLYACPVGLVEFDSSGTIKTINPHAMMHLLPLAGSRSSENLFTILERTAPEIRNMMDAFAPKRGTVCDGHRIVVDIGRRERGRTDGKTLACTMVKLSPNRAIATFADISVQVSQERRLKEADTWFASLLNGVNDYAVLSITLDGVIDAGNASFTRQTGYARDEIIGQPLDTILGAQVSLDALNLAEQLAIAKIDGWYLDQDWMTRRNGERFWCQRLFAARMEDQGSAPSGYSVVLRDVVHQGTDTALLRRMLTQDQLTGAANRAQFTERMERAESLWRAKGRVTSLLMIDIDHFKAINDAHGHPAGDLVLRRFSEVCMAAMRPNDLFARVGGEEFAVLLPDTLLPQAAAIADTLRHSTATMDAGATADGLTITASFGCAVIGPDAPTAAALIKLADDRLYCAKRAGRNRVCIEMPSSGRESGADGRSRCL